MRPSSHKEVRRLAARAKRRFYIRQQLAGYHREASPPIAYQQTYIDFLDIECGNQPRSTGGYVIDLRVFSTTCARNTSARRRST